MTLDHIGMWVKDLDKMIKFYQEYFNCRAGDKYHNPAKKFTSCFVEFPAGGRVELMCNPDMPERTGTRETQYIGYIHIAIDVGSEEEVDRQAERFRNDQFKILDGPRRTGDGYYEFVVLDPEGNRIELTA